MAYREWGMDFTAILSRFTNPADVCGELNCCPPTKKYLDFNEYKMETLKGKPPVNSWPTPTNKTGTYKVLQLTDIHCDPLYTAGFNAKCGEFQCCRADSGKANHTEDISGYWGASYGNGKNCDIPLYLVDATLSSIAKTHGNDIEFIL